MKVAVNWSVFSLQRYMYQYLGSEVNIMKTLALSVIAALGLATAPAMAQEGTAGESASGAGIGGMSTQAMVFAGVAAAATVAVVSDSSSNPVVDDNPEEPTDPDPIVTVTGTGTNTYTITIPAQ